MTWSSPICSPGGTPSAPAGEWMLGLRRELAGSPRRLRMQMRRGEAGRVASRANYMAQLIAERLTGVPGESFSNAAMQWGVATEPDARSAYEFRVDCDVAPCGFIAHPAVPMSGASPDGLVGADGLVEIKCPETKTHIDTLFSGAIPDKYIKQMQFQMACAGRAWVDFVSYDPRMPEAMRLFVKRVPRADNDIRLLECAVSEFLAELDDRLGALRSRYRSGESPGASLISHDAMLARASEAPPWA